jgi:hypothetical protein
VGSVIEDTLKKNEVWEEKISRCAQYVRMNVVLFGKHKRYNSLRKSSLERDSEFQKSYFCGTLLLFTSHRNGNKPEQWQCAEEHHAARQQWRQRP